MRAAKYIDGLLLTHRQERDKWTEPQWTAHLCLLIALKNLSYELQGDPDAFWRLVECSRTLSPESGKQG